MHACCIDLSYINIFTDAWSTSTSTTASPETPWRRFFVHKWRACKDGDYVQAKRNDKNVPLNSRLPKNGKASHTVVSQK